MAFISTISVSEAEGDVREMYEQMASARGYVPNYAKLFSQRPEVMNGWRSLLSTGVSPPMS